MERSEETVIDASVAVKWFSEEEGSDRALAVRNEHIDGIRTLVAPDLLVYEIANALRFKPGFNPHVTARALDDLFNLQVDIMAPSKELVSRGSELAYEYGITVYDSLYLSLGELLGLEVITADKELYKKAEDCGFLRML
ncbi:MAG: type II toxin-antitoxin system VapC family toxin [Thaumarchaeota archaeon]|nr:type II toxin-antitoxin system VapC family toxin [Nitrososphaerota archaeon]